jgi:hypothetical protein
MRYWLRELAGWLLVGIGLLMFYLTYLYCDSRYILRAWPMAVSAIFVFRGGVHLLKVAIAARVCVMAQERLYPAPAPAAPKPAWARGGPRR